MVCATRGHLLRSQAGLFLPMTKVFVAQGMGAYLHQCGHGPGTSLPGARRCDSSGDGPHTCRKDCLILCCPILCCLTSEMSHLASCDLSLSNLVLLCLVLAYLVKVRHVTAAIPSRKVSSQNPVTTGGHERSQTLGHHPISWH